MRLAVTQVHGGSVIENEDTMQLVANYSTKALYAVQRDRWGQTVDRGDGVLAFNSQTKRRRCRSFTSSRRQGGGTQEEKHRGAGWATCVSADTVLSSLADRKNCCRSRCNRAPTVGSYTSGNMRGYDSTNGAHFFFCLGHLAQACPAVLSWSPTGARLYRLWSL